MSKYIILSLSIFITVSCGAQSSNQKFKINKDYLSTNYNSRVKQIILHYTAVDFKKSLEILDGRTERQVSSHYLVNDSITNKNSFYIYSIVSENDRSWHAGVSEWRGDTDLNNSSIGIEIVNIDGNKNHYPEKQIDAVIFLIKKLIDKYNISPINIVGHSDIAPQRKEDPGTFFPWKKLYDKGIGAWYDEADINKYKKEITQIPSTLLIKNYLKLLGYKINHNTSQKDQEYIDVVRAFQRHFSPNKVDDDMSLENYIILRALLKKYNTIN